MTNIVAHNNIEDWNTSLEVMEELADGSVIFANGGVFYAPSSDSTPRISSTKWWNGEQTCKQCGETKPIGKFRANKDAANGHRKVCKSCMSAKKPKPAGINYATVSHDVWIAEAKRACPCVVCGGEIELPGDMCEAEDRLREAVPLCAQHSTGTSMKAKMAQRQWPELVDERLQTINAWYELTIALMRVPKLKAAIGYDAERWLAGVRYEVDGNTSILNEQMIDQIGNAIEALADNSGKRGLPTKLNYHSQQDIIEHEVQLAELIGSRGMAEQQMLSYLVDR